MDTKTPKPAPKDAPTPLDKLINAKRREIEDLLIGMRACKGSPTLGAALKEYKTILHRSLVAPWQAEAASADDIALRTLYWRTAELAWQYALLDQTLLRAHRVSANGDHLPLPAAIVEKDDEHRDQLAQKLTTMIMTIKKLTKS